MIFPSARIKFDDNEELFIDPNSSIKKETVPFWTSFDCMSCPGNIAHGPEIDYCRLGVELEEIINFFSNKDSIVNGLMTIYPEEVTEIRIKGDAQTLFFNTMWFILLYSKCSVFKHHQWERRNYLPSANPDKLFYVLFSTFLVEESFTSPGAPHNLEKFKGQLKMLNHVLNNLLQRIRNGANLYSDAVSNGLVIFANTLSFLELKFDQLYIELKEQVKENSRTEKWV
ncbi:hypothetical protein WDW89_07455 [Deltaproteobacteria bacterium TL4]